MQNTAWRSTSISSSFQFFRFPFWFIIETNRKLFRKMNLKWSKHFEEWCRAEHAPTCLLCVQPVRDLQRCARNCRRKTMHRFSLRAPINCAALACTPTIFIFNILTIFLATFTSKPRPYCRGQGPAAGFVQTILRMKIPLRILITIKIVSENFNVY